MQCCSDTVSGTYPTRDGMTKSFRPTLHKSYGGWRRALLQGNLSIALLSLHLRVICWPHPSSCLVKSISLPWRSILYAVHQKISTNLGREWSVCYSLQHVCFHWVRFHFQFELTLESQVQDTWTLTFPLFHVYDTHISHLEENWPYL